MHDPLSVRPRQSRAAKRGGFKRGGGGFPIWTCPSLFVLFCPFWDFFRDFPDLAAGDFFRVFPIRPLSLFFCILRAPTRNSPEKVRDTIWTFPEKSGKPPGLETPWFSFSQESGNSRESQKNSRRLELSISKKHPARKVGSRSQGSVDPSFPAGLPFPVPDIPEYKAFCDSGKMFPAFFPRIFPKLSCRKLPQRSRKQSKAFSSFLSSNGGFECTSSTIGLTHNKNRGFTIANAIRANRFCDESSR